MNFLSVCSGIEAASVAWNPLGWKAWGLSEIEPFPCAVLAHHYPGTPNLGDMTKFGDWPDGSIDLLCGGTPCQSFSVAGLRKGLDDPRGNLMLTFGAIAARYRPRWLVWENVPGVLSSNEGRDFGAFLGLLGVLGYGFAYRVLDAQYFGLAQRRKRVFVVGCIGDWRRAAAVLFERHGLQGHPAPIRQTREGTAEHAARSVAIRGRDGVQSAELGEQVANAILTPGGGRAGVGVGAVLAPERERALTTSGQRLDGETETLIPSYIPPLSATLIARSSRGGGQTNSPGFQADKELIAFSAKDYGGDAMSDLSPTLRAGGHAASHANAGVMPAIAFGWQNSAAQGASESEHHRPTLDKSKTPAVSCGMRVRRLTPNECERLQGLPVNYTAVPYNGNPAKDGPRYKAIGNSWAVPCPQWIGRRIDAVNRIAA